MKTKIFLLSAIVFSLLFVSNALAAFTVSVSIPTKSLTENEQVSVTVTVTNTGTSTETSVIVTLAGSPTSWFSTVQDCSVIASIAASQSGTSTCIIRPTSVGTDLTLTATAQKGDTNGQGSTSGITVSSASSSLTASVSGDSSVGLSATFYVSVAVTAPSSSDATNVRATISESGACTVDTSSVPATQTLGTVGKGTTKSPLNWQLTSSSSSGTCSITVNVVSDNAGSANPTKSITVGTASSSSSSSSGAGGGGGGGGGAAEAFIKITSTGVTRDLGVGGAVKFTVSNANHTVKVKEVGNNSVTLEITSTTITVTMTVGETKKFDLDSDNIYDTEITLNSITNKRAKLTFRSIGEPIPGVATTATQTEATTTTTEKPREILGTAISVAQNTWVLIGAVIIVLVIGLTFILKFHGKKSS